MIAIGVYMRIAGIDPGTHSFDVVVLENGRVVKEESFETKLVAENPRVLINTLRELNPNYIVAPSGYGIPLDNGGNIRNPRKLAIEVLLLSTEKAIRKGVEAGEIGIWVYDALAKTVVELVEGFRNRVIFIPGVIHLPTVPIYRKINRVDMGTADKLASTFLAVYEYSSRYGIPYNSIDFILLEAGFGYYGVIGVKSGRIVDGIGGTIASSGTLTSGLMDLEIVAGAETWERWDVFHGGILDYTGLYNFEDFIARASSGEEPFATLLDHFIDGIVKDVMRVYSSTPNSSSIVVTGRLGKIRQFVDILVEKLRGFTIESLSGLPGAKISKEAAQGYTAIGAGVVGDREFQELLVYMKINESCGTSVDYIIHPRARNYKERVKKAYLESVFKAKTCIEVEKLGF